MSSFLRQRRSTYLGMDMGSYGIVKVLEDHLGQTYPDMPWEPKAAFAVLADVYGN